MIITNPNTKKRFFFSDDREKFVSFRVGMSGRIKTYKIADYGAGIVLEGDFDKSKADEYIGVGQLIRAIEVDENGDIVVYNEDDPKQLTFNALNVVFMDDGVKYMEKKMARGAYGMDVSANTGLYAWKMQDEKSKKQVESMVAHLVARCGKYDVLDVCRKYDAKDERYEWWLIPEFLFRHLDMWADCPDYRWLAKQGFTCLLGGLLKQGPSNSMQNYFRKLHKALEDKSFADMNQEDMKYLQKEYAWHKSFFLQLYVMENMTIEDIEKYKSLFGLFKEQASLKKYKKIRKSMGLQKEKPEVVLKAIMKVIKKPDKRLVKCGIKRVEYLCDVLDSLIQVAGEKEAARICGQVKDADELQQIATQYQEEARKRTNQENEKILEACAKENDFRHQCELDEEEKSELGPIRLYRVDSCQNNFMKVLATTNEFEKEDAFLSVHFLHGKKVGPVGYIKINGKSRDFQVYCETSDYPRYFLHDIMEKLAVKYTERMHSCFLMRKLA